MTPRADRLDSRAIDWPRVVRAVYGVRQHYRYDYTGPVTDLKQRLVMIPPDRYGEQLVLDHRIAVRGAEGEPTLIWESDSFGNRITSVRAARVKHAIDFEAAYRVERRAGEATNARPAPAGTESAAAGPAAELGADPRTSRRRSLESYLEPTALTRPEEPLRAAARELAAGAASPRERAERAHTWAAGVISYQLGVTGVQTPAAMALHLGRGVCQDYAHILLCVLRLLEIPARYVSGHLLGEGAPHAWVEALLEDPAAPGGLEVVAYDPTHHRRTGLNYITVAVGRDFADISPTSGFFTGPAVGTLSASKQAEIVEIEYGDDGQTDEAAV